jgi:hypothetical protein
MSPRGMHSPDDDPDSPPPDAERSARWVWQSAEHHPRRWHEALRHALPSGRGWMESVTYLLVRHSTGIVKLRQDRVDVKRLMATDPSGLEAWQTVRRATLPWAPSLIKEICLVWERDPPHPCPTIASMDAFHALLAQHCPEVRVLPARSWQREYRLFDCRVRRRTMLVSGAVLELLSVEHTDLATLRAAIEGVHLAAERHTSTLTALRRLLGWPVGGSARG